MRPAAPPLLLLLLLAAAHADLTARDTLAAADSGPATALPDVVIDEGDAKNDTLDTITLANGTVIQIDPSNSTLDELGDDHEPVVRKKRTFGDIVFRGLADVLGYAIQRKPPQAATFPPPVALVPGIDTPLQAGPAPAAPAAPPAPPPCGAPRAVGPPPCRAQRPPPPKPAPPPCPQPRAVPKPRPPPPPPPPPPCAKPRANPATPAPCAPAPPPPKQQADPNLETISSNFQLNFNFARNTPAPPSAQDNAEDDQGLVPPIAIEPRAAKLPPAQQREPRVYVDAFVVRNGVPQKVNTIDAKAYNSQQAADEDYLADDEEEAQQLDDDDYEDVQESRDQAVKQFGAAVNRFWQKKRKQAPVPVPEHYQTVHFGDRVLTNQLRRNGERESHQNLQRNNANTNTINLPLPEAEEEAEVTTTTEDPRRPLKPRVLPPTEHNPGQIDTVTVRVPPIYREKRPRKLHRERPDRPDRDEYGSNEAIDSEQEIQSYHEADTEGEDTVPFYRTEAPIKRRRRRKQNRKARSVEEGDRAEQTKDDEVDVFGEDYDYFGKKLPISKEEQFFRGLTIPPPTKDPDLARIEDGVENEKNGHFLNDHERLREDPERTDNSGRFDKSGRSKNSGRSKSSGRTDDSEKILDKNPTSKDNKRSEQYRAEESERSDRLSPNARVHETGYRNNYVRAKNVQVEDPRPRAAP